ncbi:MAG: 1,4-dihydroxy-2-naphthoate octaprenyltransferase [Dysgonamonadaceae bacterium]|nr:1,4-dihydroxy-2-naphthoate octaprenyltransferase [Dysgonamonadaceae bacterium]
MDRYTFKYWLLAIRPKTLLISAMPVLVGCALTWKEGKLQWIPAVICFLFALIAQIAFNLFNDYSDFINKRDRENRTGSESVVTSGCIQPSKMLNVSIILITWGCLLGLALIFYTGWEIVLVGIATGIGVFAYSSGPYPLSHKGLGDICALLFYGIIPVGFTYYVQTLEWTFITTICGLAMGIVSVNVSLANNYRDRKQDAISGKRTTVVIFGEKFGRYFYVFNGIVAVCICFSFVLTNQYYAAFIPALYLIPHLKTWRKMSWIRRGKGLNSILMRSAKNVLIFGILLCIGILMGKN